MELISTTSTERARMQVSARDIVSKPFSSEFPFLQRAGPMKSISFAMLKAEKT